MSSHLPVLDLTLQTFVLIMETPVPVNKARNVVINLFNGISIHVVPLHD